MPLSFSAAELADHVRWAGIDLGRSLVALSSGAPAGISLAAVEGDEAWIGGLGVAPPFRRVGLGARTFARHCGIIDARGVVATRLEVIDVNPARRLYRSAGFAETSTLSTLDVALVRDGSSALEELGQANFSAAHHSLRGASPATWRRRPAAMSRAIATGGAVILGVRRRDAIVTYAAVRLAPTGVIAIDMAAADADAADRLFGGLRRRYGGVQMRIVDERPESAIGVAAARLSPTPVVT